MRSFETSKVCSVKDGDLKNGLNIEFAEVNYPYGGSPQNLQYIKDANGTLIIQKNLKINANGLSPEDKKCFKQQIKKEFEEDINCQVGATKKTKQITTFTNRSSICSSTKSIGVIERVCPTPPNKKRSPKVKFALNIYLDTEKIPKNVLMAESDNITIHQCFHSGLKKGSQSNCTEVMKYNQNRCITRTKSVGMSYYDGSCEQKNGEELKRCCEKIIQKIYEKNPDSLMRANKSNVSSSSSMGSWRHEILHQFGLKDEYSKNNYPFSPQGTDTSIMRKSRRIGSTIKPWHVDYLIGNLECKKQ